MNLPNDFFRTEPAKIVASLTRSLGGQHLSLAEDATQDAVYVALTTWAMNGVPQNPGAWLTTVARNKALDILRKQGREQEFVEDVPDAEVEDDENLLHLMFVCCHPGLSQPSQIALILNTLCRMTAREIASAYLQPVPVIEKRITRAKQKLAEMPRWLSQSVAADFEARLSAVRRAIYLLFNQGYHGASSKAAVEPRLCYEALWLGSILASSSEAGEPETFALVALLNFHAARLPAKLQEGELVLLQDQERALWDKELIAEGLHYFQLASQGNKLSAFHLEAAIAAEHAVAESVETTDWDKIVQYYDALLKLMPSPIVQLNRAVALAWAKGHSAALEAWCAISEPDRMAKYPFYWSSRGFFEERAGNSREARRYYELALGNVRNDAERASVEAKLKRLNFDL